MTTRAHQWLGVAAAALVLAGIVGWRSIVDDKAATPVAVSSPPLDPLLPYAKPLPDSLRLRHFGEDGIVLSRDPFAVSVPSRVERTVADDSPARREPNASALTVSATLTGGTRRAAIINDELIYVGEPVPGGMTLTAVERDRVVLTDANGATHTVVVTEGEG